MVCHASFSAAERRALSQYLADLPSPAEMAVILPAEVIDALSRATRGRDGSFTCCNDVDAKELRFYGLCDFPSKASTGRLLTVLGMQVRRIVMEGT